MKEIVKEITVQKSVFIADDGTEFSTEYNCKAYENKLDEQVRLAKWDKLFGKGFEDAASRWVNGSVFWYNVVLNSKDDLIDFLTLIKKYDNCSFDSSSGFAEEVLETLNRGESYKMLVCVEEDGGFISRFYYNTNGEDSYKRWIDAIDNMAKLAETMREYIEYTPPIEK